MNLAELETLLQVQLRTISDDLVYLQTPLTLAFDGNHLGVYVEHLGSERYRLSDNAELLFTALAAGMKATGKRGEQLKLAVNQHQLQLSQQGELFCTCTQDELPYWVARFLDASAGISQLCRDWIPDVYPVKLTTG